MFNNILVCSIISQTVAVSYFTTQRLHHINETVDQLSPNVSLVGQNGVDLDPLVSNLESLEQEARILNRKVGILLFITTLLFIFRVISSSFY